MKHNPLPRFMAAGRNAARPPNDRELLDKNGRPRHGSDWPSIFLEVREVGEGC